MYKIAEHVTIEKDGESDNYVLMDLDNGRLFKLNNAAKSIIDSIVNYGDIKMYVENVCRNCDMEHDIVEQDAKRYLYQLLESGYIYEC